MLTAVTTPDGTQWLYHYDPFGRRIAKQCPATAEWTLFTWDGPTLAEQTAHSPTLPGPHTLTWDHHGLHPLTQTEHLATSPDQQEVDRRFFAIITDLIGTPTHLLNPDGTTAWQAHTTLWGTTSQANNATTSTPLRFPGQYYDPETGLHYNVHRHYDPQTARYLSADPLGLTPAPNPATYVHNPHTWSDPLGLAPYDPKGVDLSKARRVSGRFDNRGNPDEIVYRQKTDGTVTAYAVYDDLGRLVKRVDVDPNSAPHAGIPAPHALEMHINVNPKTGQEFPVWDKMPRPLRPDEEIYWSS
ncbi:RHS repeat-associated protein [Kitasatospora sp. GAS204A]|nr:RHS repeat-associated protein [Kitasatospora sp. GAS204B]